jgi:4a-hydroxytetrahydrobiopterin dehydratase
MIKFTTLLESTSKSFIVEANISLLITASNEGEAGYMSESIIGGIEELQDYTLINIGEAEDSMNESHGHSWIESNGRLTRTYDLGDFNSSVEFTKKIAEVSNELDHHPTVTINFGKVTVSIKTNKENKITDMDHKFASDLDKKYIEK